MTALAALAQLAAAKGGGATFLATLVDAYSRARTPDKSALGGKTERVRLMKKAVGERGATAMQRASACYGLIFEGERAGLWVDSMVRQARNTKGLTPAADPIAEALLHVYATTRSKRAFHHLVTLRLDGGPEETLWAVREDMLAAYPGDTANYLRRRYGKLDNPGIYRRIPRGHEFIGSLTWELQGETEACERLKGRVSRSRGAKADRDYIVAVLNRIERLRPG